jgi:parallel beta-helix repeat protein
VKKFALRFVLFFILCSLLFAILNTRIVKAQPPYYAATIRADGTVDPDTAPIQRDGDVYTLTGDMDTITVQRNDMILDGNGHSLTGKGKTMAVYVGSRNVTIKNLILKDCYEMGIFLASSSSNVTVSNNTITGTYVAVPELQATGGIYVWAGGSHIITENQIANNYGGIYIGYDSKHNTIVGNNITGNNYGIGFWESSNNLIYNNNFINNTHQVSDSALNYPKWSLSVNNWDNGTTGNYWSDYNGTDNNRDGIGDTPYVIYENNKDNYPFMNPDLILSSSDTTPPFPITLIVAAIVIVVAVGAGLMVYFVKVKKTTGEGEKIKPEGVM